MQQKEKGISGKDSEEYTPTNYLRIEDTIKILAQFINVETGQCLQCGLVHSFTNIDEAIKRRQRENNTTSSSPYLDRLFWPEAAI